MPRHVEPPGDLGGAVVGGGDRRDVGFWIKGLTGGCTQPVWQLVCQPVTDSSDSASLLK